MAARGTRVLKRGWLHTLLRGSRAAIGWSCQWARLSRNSGDAHPLQEKKLFSCGVSLQPYQRFLARNYICVRRKQTVLIKEARPRTCRSCHSRPPIRRLSIFQETNKTGGGSQNLCNALSPIWGETNNKRNVSLKGSQ